MKPLKKISDFTGFRNIPGHSKHMINEEGTVVHKKTGKVQTGSWRLRGYHRCSVYNDKLKKYKQIDRHRLLSLAFKYHPDYEDLQVNHKNGRTYDDSLENLEWLTPKENNDHAISNGLFNPNKRPVSLRGFFSNKIYKFESVMACARFLNVSSDTVFTRITQGEDRYYPDGFQYRDGIDDDPWYKNPIYVDTSTFRKVIVQTFFPICETEYESLKTASIALNMALSTISIWANSYSDQIHQTNDGKLIRVKYADENVIWKYIEDPILEYSKNSKRQRPIKVVEEATGNTTIFYSLSDCARKMNILITTLKERLNCNGDRPFKGYRFTYYDFITQNSPLIW